MPPAIIAAAIVAATTVGTTIYSKMSQPSAPKQATPAEISTQAINTETSNRATATKEAGQFLPGLQANTSGGLSPDAYKQLSATFSGNADLANSPQMQELVSRFLGLDNSASFGGSEPFGSSGGSSGAANPSSPGLAG